LPLPRRCSVGSEQRRDKIREHRSRRHVGVQFKRDEQVLIKDPGPLVATVVEPRFGNETLPDEQKIYLVTISEERYYRGSSLEPLEQPKEHLEPYTKEWLAELNRFLKAATRLNANNKDAEALAQLSESGKRIGWIVPIKK
jgi:hypothetical protein